MDDDSDEIFDEDEALDCSILEEIGKEEGPQHNKGCLGTVIIFIGIVSVMTFAIQNLLF